MCNKPRRTRIRRHPTSQPLLSVKTCGSCPQLVTFSGELVKKPGLSADLTGPWLLWELCTVRGAEPGGGEHGMETASAPELGRNSPENSRAPPTSSWRTDLLEPTDSGALSTGAAEGTAPPRGGLLMATRSRRPDGHVHEPPTHRSCWSGARAPPPPSPRRGHTCSTRACPGRTAAGRCTAARRPSLPRSPLSTLPRNFAGHKPGQ